jgi:hypothetical protein
VCFPSVNSPTNNRTHPPNRIRPPPQFKMDEQLPGHTEYLMRFEEVMGRSRALRFEQREVDRANGSFSLPWQVRPVFWDGS